MYKRKEILLLRLLTFGVLLLGIITIPQDRVIKKKHVDNVMDEAIINQTSKKDSMENSQIKKEKAPASQNNFIMYFTNKSDYTIMDASNQFLQDEVNTVLIAIGKNYAIEFYDMTSDKIALNICKNIVESNEWFLTPQNNKYMEYYYDTIKKDVYFCLSKVDNTIIYTYAPMEFKEEVRILMKDLGY